MRGGRTDLAGDRGGMAPAPRDGSPEIRLEDRAAMKAGPASPEDVAAGEDMAAFAASIELPASEEPVIVGPVRCPPRAARGSPLERRELPGPGARHEGRGHLVTGGAAGIGRACAGVGTRGHRMGAEVAVEHGRARGGGGVIVDTASVQGSVGERGFPAQRATRGAVAALTRSLAVHAPDVRAVAIAPRLIETEAVRAIPADPMAEVVAAIPAGRAAAPEEVASPAALAASDEAHHIGGAAVILDGAHPAIG